jgi:hypothetical protein
MLFVGMETWTFSSLTRRYTSGIKALFLTLRSNGSRQISLSISLHCLRVNTARATLSHAGTSKPRDTRRRLTIQANAYPSRISPQIRSAYLSHTHTWGKAILHVT